MDPRGIGWGKRRGWESHVQRKGAVRGSKEGVGVALACIVHAMHTHVGCGTHARVWGATINLVGRVGFCHAHAQGPTPPITL